MGNDQRSHIARPRTRMPFRVAAFVLGVLFVAFGLYELATGSTAWMNIGFALCVALTGAIFSYSAITEEWRSPLAFLRSPQSRTVRFLVVDPDPLAELDAAKKAVEPSHQPLNPYSPPRNPAVGSSIWQLQTEASGSQSLSEHFLAGSHFIHYGVVIFLDPNDQSTVHSAIPLSSSSEQLVERHVHEAIRVVQEFLRLLPDMDPLVRDRRLVIRMISSYHDLNHEVSERVVVGPDRVRVVSGEPSDGRGAADSAFLNA